MENYKEYAQNIPEDVKIVIASLDNQIRQAILVLLSRNIELSFSDIQKELGLDRIKLNFHLKNLFSSALIDHYYRHEVGNPNYSYYSISQLGRRVLVYLIQAFVPPSPIYAKPPPKSYFEKYVSPDDSINPFWEAIGLNEEKKYVIPRSHSGAKIDRPEPDSINYGIYTRAVE